MIIETPPPATVNVTVNTTEDSQAKQVANQKLLNLYPNNGFNFISATIIDNKWVGLYAILPKNNSTPSIISNNTNDSSNQLDNNSYIYIPKIIVVFTIENKKLSSPEKPFEHDSPIIIPMKADSEDSKIINNVLPDILSGHGILNSGILNFKYRTNTFAFWNKDTNELNISQGKNLIQCDIDKNGVSISNKTDATINSGVISDNSTINAQLENELSEITNQNKKDKLDHKDNIELTRKDFIDCLKSD